MGNISHCDLYKRAMQSDSQLCIALQQLKDEHEPLRKQMKEIDKLAQKVTLLPPFEDRVTHIRTLHKKVLEFEKVLTPHAEREEGLLFPMMVKYVGYGGGPIAVMEFEHNQAKGYLDLFLEQAEKMGETIDESFSKEMASNVIKVCYVLSDHFLKEEEVLFPNAQQLLNEEEKELLYFQFHHKNY